MSLPQDRQWRYNYLSFFEFYAKMHLWIWRSFLFVTLVSFQEMKMVEGHQIGPRVMDKLLIHFIYELSSFSTDS